MDDPWGSPWADDVPLEDKKAAEGGREAILKTQAPAKAATLALQVNTNSPWDDNEAIDDFGDWSVSPAVEGQDVNQVRREEEVAWPSVAGRNEGAEIHTKSLSPSWDEGFTLSQTPRLAPSPMPKQPLRQSSPDPWAKAFVADEEPGETLTKDAALDGEVPDSSHEIAHHTSLAIPDTPPSANDFPVDSEARTITDNATSLDEGDVLDYSSENSRNIIERPQSPPIAEPTPSRPSSSPSTGSQHEGPPDSSRTSFDEEPKRPQIPRKVSSKIQELVEHFDGLANQSEEIPQDVGRKLSQSGNELEGGVSDESADDFGDFEEEHLGSVGDESSEETDGGLQNVAANHVMDTPIASSSPPQSPIGPTVKEPPSPHRMRGPDIKPVQIDVDLDILDTLYPVNDTIPSQEPIFIPDTLPHDSFSSTEERKMWYRISRYGPMRQHNSGDDENYVRISWLKSNVRDDTLKIVARWMEEDRVSGQIILGGPGKTSSGFGWNDSKAAPVSLETAFAARDKKRTAPLTAPTMGRDPTGDQPRHRLVLEQGQRGSTNAPVASVELKASPVSPVADFGWNVAPDSSSTFKQTRKLPQPGFPIADASLPVVSNSPNSERNSLSPLRAIALPETFKATEPAQPTLVTPVDTNTKILAPSDPLSPPASFLTTDSNQDDEDDDWGDLVSSPTAATTAAFQPPVPLRHKKSQSLNGSGLSSFDLPRSFGPPPQQTRSSHRSNMSFDEVLTPRYQSNASATSLSGLGISAVPALASTPRGPGVHITESKDLATPITNDSWASMDVSFFETASVPHQKLSPDIQSGTVLNRSYSPSGTSVLVPPTTGLQSKQEDEQNKTVQRIVSGLPDLSYMLRR